MKTKNFLLTGLVGLGTLTACSNEELANSGNNGLPDGKAYAQIMVNVATETGSRASGDTDAGTTQEQGIKDITVVLADANGMIQQVITPGMKSGGKNNEDRATELFEVPAGKYYVYVLANYNDNASKISPQLVAGQTNMKQTFTLTGMPFTANETLGQTGSLFLMTNADNVSESNFTGNPTGTEKDDDGADASGGATNVFVVNANIERVVSKVTFTNSASQEFSVEVDPDGDGTKTTIAKAQLQGAALINLNKKMFMNKVVDDAVDPANKWSGYFYVKDPNYDQTIINATTNGTWLGENFYQATVSDGEFVSPVSTNMLYCPENTMIASAQQNGQTTGVVYKVKYTPTAADNAGYTVLAKDATDSYSQVYTALLNLSSGKDDAITETMFTTSDNEDGTFYSYNGLVFISKNAAILYYTIDKAADKSKVSDINTAFGGNKGSALTEVKTYTDGICYYTAWIKHNPDSQTRMEAGRFGTVRNHWYVMGVNSIKGLGSNQPTFDKPEDPDDPAVANIQVVATIKKWVKVEQKVDLE